MSNIYPEITFTKKKWKSYRLLIGERFPFVQDKPRVYSTKKQGQSRPSERMWVDDFSQLVGENEPVMVKHEWNSYITGEGQTDASDLLCSIAPLFHMQRIAA